MTFEDRQDMRKRRPDNAWGSLGWMLGLLLVVLALPYLQTAQSPPGTGDLISGGQALQEKDLAGARSAFARAAKASGGRPEILMGVSELYTRAGMEKEAEPWRDAACSEMDRAAGKHPDDGPWLNDYAYLCWAEPGRNLDQAIPTLQRAVDLTRGEGAVMDSLGWAYFQRYRRSLQPEDLHRATDALERALVSVTNESTGLFGLAASEDSLKEVREHLIAVYMAADRPEIENEILNEQWSLKASLGAAWLARWRDHPDPRALETATSLLEDAVSQQPNDAFSRLNLGLAYAARRQREMAYIEIQKAVWLDPQLPEGRAALDRLEAPG